MMAIDDYPFHCEMLEARSNEDCGCPEELWLMGTLEVTIHLEENGDGHIFADAGDWEDDLFVTCTGVCDLRKQAADWVNALSSRDAQ